jgi:arylsulfate sulfotransferase
MQKKYRVHWTTGFRVGNLAGAKPAGAADRTKCLIVFVLAALCPVAMLASDAAPAKSTPITTAALSTFFYDFGNNLVGNPMIQTAVMVTNTGKATLLLNPVISGDPSFSIVTAKSCGPELAAGKSCDEVLRYDPIRPSYPKPQNAVLNLNFGNAAPGVPETVDVTGISAVLKPGTVAPTNNSQVALYTMTLPFPGRMKVDFGKTASYGLKTWYQSTDTNNGQVSIFVAGMKAQTTYHMLASVILGDKIYVTDPAGDHTFKTGIVPNRPINYQYHVTATTYPGMTPQPGIELTNPLNGLAAFDLEGNQIWTYYAPSPFQDDLDGFKLLPNGDFLLVIGSAPGEVAPIEEIREIDLAGDIVREVSIGDLNASLQTAPSTCKECPGLQLSTFHHDVTPLPNGHVLALASTVETLSPAQTGEPKTAAVRGDVVVDLDENLNPVWAWNEFNHLSTMRHPYQWPDWTHSNAVLYSPDDGNFLISIRHQNWIVKVKYEDGSGDGSIIWKLGEGGSFKLIKGSDPVDWPYAQHDPGFFSPNTSGVFSLGVMDNGDDRLYPPGSACTPQASLPPSCLYSTIPVFEIDEDPKVMTATLTFHQELHNAPANQSGGALTDLYNYFGGNTDELPNGDVEYDLCGLQVQPAIAGTTPGAASLVREVTQDPKHPKTVWTLELQDDNFYRAFRMPSLYPGVQW